MGRISGAFKNMNNKILLIISGESFRDGGQNSRKKDTQASLETQLLATDSHIKFIENIQNKYDISFDIQIISYQSKFQDQLIKKYEKYNLTYNFYDTYFRDRTQLTNSKKIDNLHQKYLGVLVIRPDMFLKDYFTSIFNPFVEKIHYISVCFLYHHICKNNIPRINDTSIYIPHKYFKNIYYDIGIKLYHESIVDYLGHGLSLNDFDFWLHSLHDSDSAKDYNPVCYLVSRPRNKIWHSYSYEIDNKTFLPELAYKKFDYPDWNITDNIKSKHNFDELSQDNLWEWWHQDPNKFSKFIDLITIDTNITNKIVKTEPIRHKDETFWQLYENQKLVFYNQNKTPTAILYKNDNNHFIGGSIDKNFKFVVRKLL